MGRSAIDLAGQLRSCWAKAAEGDAPEFAQCNCVDFDTCSGGLKVSDMQYSAIPSGEVLTKLCVPRSLTKHEANGT
jgi:hypothetical protein